MRIRARIVIDIDADDLGEAASHRERVERLFQVVQAAYDQAHLNFGRSRYLSSRARIAAAAGIRGASRKIDQGEGE